MNFANRLQEKTSLWDVLKQALKPIVLYGMGDGALKIMAVLKQRGIPLAGIFASDEFVRGHSFEGYPVRTLQQTKQEFGDFIILLAFGVFRPELLQKICELNEQYELYAPDVPVILNRSLKQWCAEPTDVFDLTYLTAHLTELEQVYHLLCDEQSKQVLLQILNFKLSGKISYLQEATSPMQEVYEMIIQPGKQEVYLDLGAYNGDTVLEYVEACEGCYDCIIALEPDRRNFRKLKQTVEKNALRRVNLHHLGVYDQKGQLPFSAKSGRNSMLDCKGVMQAVTSVDELLAGDAATIIKYDVEGAEQAAIAGSERTIQRYHPRLLVSAYHKTEDLFALPLQIQKINPDYQIYLRHHPYIPAWETNFYFCD